MKRVVWIAAAVLVVVAAVVWALRVPIALRVVGRAVARNMQSTLIDELPDGLHVGLCGAGSPLPDPKRSGPCVFVIAGKRLFVIDAGSGSSRVMSRIRVPQGQIEAILLTHFHSDHIDGLGELELQRWVNGSRDTPVPVFGPPGVEAVVDGFNLAYQPDRAYRVAHHGVKVVPPSGAGAVARRFVEPADGDAPALVDDGGVVIRVFRVDHAPVDPAVGYRVEYGGRAVVISGDTKKSPNVQRFAEGADVLLHEALSPALVSVITDAAESAGRSNLAKVTRDILDYHTTPVEAAEIARDAHVGALVYYHVVPPLLLAPMEDAFLEGVDAVYDGPVTVSRDGTLVSLPSGSDRIEVRELL